MFRKIDDLYVKKLALTFASLFVGLTLCVGAASAAPTRAQFIRQGDALCTQVKRDLVPVRRQAEAAKALPRAQMWSAVTRLWTSQIQIQRRFTLRFHALGLPAGDSRAHGIVSGLDLGLVLATRVRNGFASRSTSALATALPAYLRHTVSLNKRVVAYGFRVCGR